MVRQNEINKESLLFNKIDNFDDEDSSEGWINWFCELEGHDFFIEVDEDYITDSFNLFGLKAIVPRYDEALEMILSPDTPESEDLKNQNFLDLYQSAMDLYGLIHARFILTPKGLQMMRDKFSKNVFGACPRILCDRQSVLPIGMSEDLSKKNPNSILLNLNNYINDSISFTGNKNQNEDNILNYLSGLNNL